jgi:preprotein translocase subunit SecA
LIRQTEAKLGGVSEADLLSQAKEVRETVASEGCTYQSLVKYCSLADEATFRAHGYRLYDVQVAAVGAAIGGNIVEMQTGEGKTIVTGIVAALKTLQHSSVHVGTTNPYLAARDLESLIPIYSTLGITHGLLPEESNEAQSRSAYRQQVVYGPGYQYGFDYLRDQMFLRRDRKNKLGLSVMNRIRGQEAKANMIQPAEHGMALIDEADSVMIDEAMTPLIISMPSNTVENPAPYLAAKKIAADFVEDEDYSIEWPSKKVTIFDEANDKAHMAVEKQVFELVRPWRIYISNAVRATHTFKRDIDYVVVDSKVQIVDPYTGRIAPDRTWQDGLHQAIECKENVPIQPGRDSTAQITRQRYLQLYEDLAGLTGTASSVAPELLEVYGCQVVGIPTNRECLRKIERTRFFADQDSKFTEMASEILSRHRTGQPILVGTRTIAESFQVRDALLAVNLNPTVLNGVQDKEEAEIVAQAGIAGSITIATNMAGRGTDIKLDQQALDAGGLHVIGTSHNASRRIDRQLVGRAARQGQPGSAQFFTAATDELLIENNSSLVKSIPRRASKSGESTDFTAEILKLQESIERRNFKQRQEMILRDRWMDKVREAIEKE